jgi:DNA-binding SARP family transcriptional activator
MVAPLGSCVTPTLAINGRAPTAAPRRAPAPGPRGRADTNATLTLQLLRNFELRREDDVVSLPMSTQRLVAFLALRGRALRRVHVAGMLWIDASEEHANACLRTALWRLKRLSATMITATSTHLAFSDAVVVDVRDAATQATEILQGRHDGKDGVLALSDAGELLPDWYDDWVLIERERLRQLVMHALERLSADATAAGRFADATEAGLAAVAQEPLRESAHRLVVEAHLADGNPGEAIRQYRLFSRLLDSHLGLEPSPRMNALVSGLPVGDDRVT